MIDKRVAYRPDIDGLRAFAIIFVVAFHAGLPMSHGGYIGVDVFFVISGYLISSNICRDLQEERFSLRGFYERRAKRILPAFLVVIAACSIGAFTLLSPTELRKFGIQAVSALTSTSNIYYWLRSDYFSRSEASRTLLMTWSLGVEEQFYLLFPLMLMVLRRRPRSVLLGVLLSFSLISFVYSIFALATTPKAAFFLLPPRWWELGAGTLLGVYETSSPAARKLGQGRITALCSFTGMAILILAVTTYRAIGPYPGLRAGPPVLATILLLRTKESWINLRVLSVPALTRIGLVSYSWYLWHWPLLSFLYVIYGGTAPVLATTLTVLLSFVLALVSYKYIEGPSRRAPTTPRTLWKYALASGLCVLPGTLAIATSGLPGRYPVAAAMDHTMNDPPLYRCIEDGNSLTQRPEGCRAQETAERPVLAVMGDSHAAALARYLRSASGAQGWSLTEYTRNMCPQLGSISSVWTNDLGETRSCAAFNRRALQQVLQDPHIKRVLLAGYWASCLNEGVEDEPRYMPSSGPVVRHITVAESLSNFEKGMTEVIWLLQAQGKTVIVATDAPRLSADPQLIQMSQLITPRRAIMRWLAPHRSLTVLADKESAPAFVAGNTVVRKIAFLLKVDLLDVSSRICPDIQCSQLDGSEGLYEDDNHLSVKGAEVGTQDFLVFKPQLIQ